MLYQILAHTPFWVWLILALLVSRGIAALRDRRYAPARLLIVPLVLLALSLSGLLRHYGLAGLPAWGVGLVLGAAVYWQLSGSRLLLQQAGEWWVRGSAVPLVMMLVIFLGKYASEVGFAISPQALLTGVGAVVLPLLFGLFNGLLIGRNAKLWWLTREPLPALA